MSYDSFNIIDRKASIDGIRGAEELIQGKIDVLGVKIAWLNERLLMLELTGFDVAHEYCRYTGKLLRHTYRPWFPGRRAEWLRTKLDEKKGTLAQSVRQRAAVNSRHQQILGGR